MMHGRRTAALVLTLGISLGATACGGDATVTPTKSGSATPTTSVSPTPTPTPTPTPSPSAKPLSKFEDEAPVKVARQWAAALATDVNNKDKSYPASGAVSTKKAQGYMGDFGNEDIGLVYPGPLPFTPTRVTTAGGTATVTGCFWVQGWAQDPTTKLPARKRKISRLNIVLKKLGGTWKFDDFVFNTSGDCSSTPVKGLPFS
jgi:hypothetical protein